MSTEQFRVRMFHKILCGNDMILHNGHPAWEWARSIPNSWSSVFELAQCIAGDGASEQMRTENDLSQVCRCRIAPPFDAFFWESGGGICDVFESGKLIDYGLFVLSPVMNGVSRDTPFYADAVTPAKFPIRNIQENISWIMWVYSVLRYDRKRNPIVPFQHYWTIRLDRDAKINSVHADFMDLDDHGYVTKDITGHPGSLLPIWPLLNTLAILNCKNVSLEYGPTAPDALVRKRAKRCGTNPYKKYKILSVSSGVKKRQHGGSGDSKNSMPLHLCRGHFKKYDEKPLFGKLRGTFWIPQHMKGSRKVGEVVKEAYEIGKDLDSQPEPTP